MRLFLHVAAMNNSWYSVYREIYEDIVSSGLLEACSKLTIGFIGPPKEFVKIAEELVDEKYELLYFGTNLEQYEFPTLNLLDQYCKEGDEPVMYCHTKGISNPDHMGKKYWRRAMSKSVIMGWRKCVAQLADYDAVGYNLHTPKHTGGTPIHFSGNWWWTRPEYIRSCIPILELQKRPRFIALWLGNSLRFQCEFWLRTGHTRSSKWKSTGVGNLNREYTIDPIVQLDEGVQDPFDFAGIKADKRYLINMAGQYTRLESALKEISLAGIRDVEVFEAIVPNDLGESKLRTHGQLGCYLSNMKCIENAFLSNAEGMVVLEDDVELAYRIAPLLKDCFKDVPDDWDILFVGGYEKNHGPYDLVKHKIWKAGDHWGTHCYILSKSGIHKMYEYLTTHPIEWEIDMLMVHHMPNLVKYSIHPTLATQKPFKSNTRPTNEITSGYISGSQSSCWIWGQRDSTPLHREL